MRFLRLKAFERLERKFGNFHYLANRMSNNRSDKTKIKEQLMMNGLAGNGKTIYKNDKPTVLDNMFSSTVCL